MMGNVCLGQITYTGPVGSGSVSCPSGTTGSSCSLTFNAKYKLYISSISGNTANLVIEVCTGSTLSSGTFYLKEGDACATASQSNTWAVSGTSGPYYKSINLSHTGTKNFTLTNTNTAGTTRAYSNTIAITGTTVQNPDLKNINLSGPPPSVNQGQTISVSNQVQNIGSGNASSSNIGYWISDNSILSGSDTFIGSTSTPSINAGNTSGFLSKNVTIPANLTPGNYYFFFKCDNDNTINESSETNNTDYFQFTVLAPTPPSLQVESCFATNFSAFNVGEIMNGSVAVRNTPSSQSWTGTITVFMKHTISGTTTNLVSQNYTIPGGNSQTIYFNDITMNYPTGTYKLYCQYTNSPNGGIDFIKNNSICSTSDNTSTGTITPTKLITITSSPNLVCGTATITPTNPVQNQSATFNFPIANTGTAAYTGTLKLMWRNATDGFTLQTYTGGIVAGGNYAFNYNDPSLSSAPGTWFLRIEDANNNVICTKTVTVVAQPSCITWSGTPPTGDKLTAANYLCTAGIIKNTQDGNENKDFGVTRELLAKITYLSIFKGSALNSPAVNFPVPFTDMQGSSTQYMDAIKTLAYLQFSDETTPFDRDLINFNPTNLIPRKFVIKAIAEAYNIAKSTASPSPFSDVSTTDPMYGYIKRFHELGFVFGNTVNCTTGTCFHPDENITREDVFLVLWRILTATNITRPTATQLNSSTNYFTPGNNRMATMGKVPGIDQANFNHYQKTSFSIAGRGVSLDFTHTYNSFLTELPKGFFEQEVSTTTTQNFIPLGIGWTHTYNIYAQKIAGYTGEPDKIMIFYPDGSINTFNYATGIADGVGIYDVMTKTAISGGERITITTKGQIKYVLENFNNGKFYFIKSIKDRNNNGVDCTWSSYLANIYRLTKVQENSNGTLGRFLTFNYNTLSPYITSVVDNAINRTISFQVDALRKNLSWFKDAKNQQTNYSYDTSGSFLGTNLLTQIQLPKGNKITNTYAQNKLKQSQTFSAANVATSTTAVNWTPEYAAGQQYNSKATVTDSQNRQTKYTHNTLGNPTQIVSPTGTSTFNSYDTGNNANLPTSLTINGQQSGISYDTKGNILNVSKNGITNTFTYTMLNDVKTHTDGKGFITTYSYDGVGNLATVQRPSGYGLTTIARNSFGQVQSVTNPAGIITTFGYNTNGLTNQISMPLGISTSSTYDNASRLLSTTDANGKTNSFLYDNNDNLTQSTDANSQKVTHGYDANDNHLTIKNPKNETQTNTYNWDDDTLKDETFGAHVKSYTYYEDGSLKTHTRGNGTFTYSYFPDGRLKSDGQTSYTYDAKGNIATVTKVATSETLNLYYDPNDRLDYYTDYYGNTVNYSYDNNNNVTEIVYPGNKTVKYTYDAVNRCTDVTDWNTKNTHFDYETDDRIKKITLPNGTYTDYTYDAAGRPTGIFNKTSSGTTISSYGFTMDNAGNHLTETITEPSITAGLQTISNQTVNYGAAPYNQLQSQGSTNFTHNTAGGITQTGSNAYTYDLNDNMLTAPNSSFAYDGAGNRRSKTVGGVNTRYVLSILGMSQVLMETNSSNAVQNYYVYGPTGLLYRLKADNTTYSYYHYDYRGSTTAITNQAQTITHSYSYDPFGKVLAITEADANPFQYVGKYGVQYESPTLTFMRARYYDPTIGRFLSEDPVWALNLYPYADNNPVMGIDPKGENTQKILDGFMLSMDVISEKIVTYTNSEGNIVEKVLNVRSKVFSYTLNGALIWSNSEKGLWDKVAESLGMVASDLLTSAIAKNYIGVLKIGAIKGYLVGQGITSAFMDNYYGIRYGYNSEKFNQHQSDVSKGWGLIIDSGIVYYNSITKTIKTKSAAVGAGSTAPMPKLPKIN